MNAVSVPRDACAIFLLLHRPSKEDLMPFSLHSVSLKKKKKKVISSNTKCSVLPSEQRGRNVLEAE